MNLVRYPFFAVNSLFMILGIGILSMGILLLTNSSIIDQLQVNIEQKSNYSEGADRADVPAILRPFAGPRWLEKVRDPACYLLIVFGSMYFTLSFIGYCGGVKDSTGIMLLYASLLITIFVIQIVGVSLYLKYKPDLKDDMINAINRQYRSEEMREFTQFEYILDTIMINHKCCGVNNEKDFKEAYSHVYLLRSMFMDPRSSRGPRDVPHNLDDIELEDSEESETEEENDEAGNDVSSTTENVAINAGMVNTKMPVEGRVITGEKLSERQVPVSCCKLNLTSVEAVKMLRNIYRKQDDKLELLRYAFDSTCVTDPDETNAYVDDGCFDKIHAEISTPLRVGAIILGSIQLCGLVLAIYIFITSFYIFKQTAKA
ncbi:unnamed protein product [Orchesella dallaii]|uniref:Tetraspanin n=1 Tax=Orchesella dallaii TaxID=48710 RepID=A0ABP1QYV0_9HEXA